MCPDKPRSTIAWVPLRGQHHVRLLPLLFVEGRIEWAVYDFMTSPSRAGLSATALSHRALTIKALYDYHAAIGRPVLDQDGAEDIYADLGRALSYGTIQNGVDPLGLYWRARRWSTSSVYLAAMREFATFLRERSGGSNPGSSASPASLQLGRNFRRHDQVRKDYSIFAHLKGARRSYEHAGAAAPNPLRGMGNGRRKSTPPPFPEKILGEFFAVGLQRTKRSDPFGHPIADRYNIRDFLYFLMLAFGGLRAAEPLHLFVDDIEADDEVGQGTTVSLWHPVDGPEPRVAGGGTLRYGPRTRLSFLAEEYQRVPRNLLGKHPHAAGWKNLLLDETVPGVGSRTRLYWQSPAVGELFWRLHGIYMRHVRPRNSSHPYYFVSLSRWTYGEPWTDAGARDAFERALRRIGLAPDSSIGLCRHAFRHRLGHRLVKQGMPPLVIQQFLHHQSVASQLAYCRPRPGDVAAVLAAADAKRERGGDFGADELGISWKSDPLGMFQGPSEQMRVRLLDLAGELSGS